MEYRDTLYFALKRLRVAKLRLCKELTRVLGISRLFGFTKYSRERGTSGRPIRCNEIVCKVDDGTFTEIVAKAIAARLKEWPYANTAAAEAVKVLRPYLCQCGASSGERIR